jgi:capsular polysaccharide biosynthesis protein
MQRYLTVCRRWWWIVLATFLVTILATMVLVGSPTRMYESTSSFVIQPQALQEGDQVRALDALVQGGTVGETYASIARSKLVRTRAAASLTPEQRAQHMAVSAEVVTGTRIIQLAVRSQHPADARRFADAVSRQTIAYVNGLADNYRLDRLDAPTLPKSPLPTRRVVTYALAGILGLMLGVGLAFLADYLWAARMRQAEAASARPEHADALWTPAPRVPEGMSVAHAGVGPSNHWSPPRKPDVDSPA